MFYNGDLSFRGGALATSQHAPIEIKQNLRENEQRECEIKDSARTASTFIVIWDILLCW